MVAIGLPLVLAAVLIGLTAPGSETDGDNPVLSTSTTTVEPASPEAKAFQTRIDDALHAFAADRLPAVIRAAGEWREGKLAPEGFARELSLFLPEAVNARQAVAAIPPLKETAVVRDLYRDSIGLYIDFGRVYLAAVDPAAEPLRGQLDLIARRLRVLADRIYDQGRSVVDPASQSLGGDSVEIRRAPEVPDWEVEGLAAGPPLAEAPAAPPEVPPEREGQRQEEPATKWLARLRQADFPSGADLAGAINAGDENRLGDLAETYLASTAALRVAPDPEGGRVRAAIAALSYLVSAESARVAQAAVVLPAGSVRDRLSTVARRLALIGENLLEPELRGAPSGFDRSLLEDGGP
ncbi:MAG: hypothetical protein M3357_14365 [Actinomycetota bacterium]|nr:hypothetical protein [Actinomycetota bacterium]